MRKVTIIISAIVIVLSAGIIVYPLISNYYTEKQHSAVYTKYTEKVNQTSEAERLAALDAAEQYNQALISGAASAKYESLLNIAGNGIMGYINISKLDIRLPIYHGSDSDTLEIGCGHLDFSSLPIGGKSTHSVITAHSGMSSQKLFSDLDMLIAGDIFSIEVLGERLYYKVFRINTVLPYQINNLQIESNEDLCSLVTCTPFGINTHRLIVTGKRIELEDHKEESKTLLVPKAEISTWKKEYLKAILVGIGIFLSVLIIYNSQSFIRKKLKRKNSTKGADTHEIKYTKTHL